ncbi:hypothetical protein EJB05_42511, partial [Eragrostis curvula]
MDGHFILSVFTIVVHWHGHGHAYFMFLLALMLQAHRLEDRISLGSETMKLGGHGRQMGRLNRAFQEKRA